jgi:threonine dehydrogenase-like Zn-dependent dehydrogenase
VKSESLDDAMLELGMEKGFDVGLEMSGNPSAFRDKLRTMDHGGKIALLGIPPEQTAIGWNRVIFKGLILKGIYAARCSGPGTRWRVCCRADSTSPPSLPIATPSAIFAKHSSS